MMVASNTASSLLLVLQFIVLEILNLLYWEESNYHHKDVVVQVQYKNKNKYRHEHGCSREVWQLYKFSFSSAHSEEVLINLSQVPSPLPYPSFHKLFHCFCQFSHNALQPVYSPVWNHKKLQKIKSYRVYYVRVVYDSIPNADEE